MTDNAKIFRKKGFGRHVNNQNEEDVQSNIEDLGISLEWTNEMKITLVILDQEERAKERGFMKRAKERWGIKYPEYQSAS